MALRYLHQNFTFHFRIPTCPLLLAQKKHYYCRQQKIPIGSRRSVAFNRLLSLLSSHEPTHKVLGALADKHRPIFTIRLRVHRALVVSNSEIAKECFTGSNDKVFSTRLKSIEAEHFSYNCANFGFSPYAPYWREMRKITMLELLPNHRLAMLSHVRESEVKDLVKKAHEIWVKKGSCLVEMKRWFDEITLKLIVTIIAGIHKECPLCESIILLDQSTYS